MKKAFIFLLALIAAISLTAYRVGVDSPNNSVGREDAIPPDFGKKGEVFLFLLTDKKVYNKTIRKQGEKHYHGPKEFVLMEELNTEKYDDTDTYRYYISSDLTIKRNEVPNLQKRNAADPDFVTRTVASYNLFVVDRKEDLTYDWPITSSFFGKLMKSYVRALEKKRLEEQGGN